jgi:hypothetical protein
MTISVIRFLYPFGPGLQDGPAVGEVQATGPTGDHATRHGQLSAEGTGQGEVGEGTTTNTAQEAENGSQDDKTPGGPVYDCGRRLRLLCGLLDTPQQRSGPRIERHQEALASNSRASRRRVTRATHLSECRIDGGGEGPFQGFRAVEQLAHIAQQLGNEGFPVCIGTGHRRPYFAVIAANTVSRFSCAEAASRRIEIRAAASAFSFGVVASRSFAL